MKQCNGLAYMILIIDIIIILLLALIMPPTVNTILNTSGAKAWTS